MAIRKTHVDRFGNPFKVGDYVVYPIGGTYAELQVGRVVELATWPEPYPSLKSVGPGDRAKLIVNIVVYPWPEERAPIVRAIHVKRIDRVARYPRDYIDAHTLELLEAAE